MHFTLLTIAACGLLCSTAVFAAPMAEPLQMLGPSVSHKRGVVAPAAVGLGIYDNAARLREATVSATSASNAAAFALSATSACTASTADSLSIQSLSATLSVSDTARYHKVLATALDVCRDARTANAVSALASNAALLGDARAAADANLKASKADKAATTGAFIVNQYYTYVMVGHKSA